MVVAEEGGEGARGGCEDVETRWGVEEVVHCYTVADMGI